MPASHEAAIGPLWVGADRTRMVTFVVHIKLQSKLMLLLLSQTSTQAREPRALLPRLHLAGWSVWSAVSWLPDSCCLPPAAPSQREWLMLPAYSSSCSLCQLLMLLFATVAVIS